MSVKFLKIGVCERVEKWVGGGGKGVYKRWITSRGNPRTRSILQEKLWVNIFISISLFKKALRSS